MVDEVFSLFKGYVTSQLQEKGKQFERSAKSDKEAADIKYKVNRKQLEVNAGLDNILTAEIDESAGIPADIHKLVAEAKLIIKKRQKLIKIADNNRDGGLVVQEYETNAFAAESEDEKKIRKAKAAVEKKRKVTTVTPRNKITSSSDFQLSLRAKTTQIYFYFVKFSVFLVGLPAHPTINLLYQDIYLWF